MPASPDTGAGTVRYSQPRKTKKTKFSAAEKFAAAVVQERCSK